MSFSGRRSRPFNNLKVRQAFAHGLDQSDHQGPVGPAGHSGVRLPDGWLPIRHQPAAGEVHQLRPRASEKANGRSRVPERQGLPHGDLQLPGRRPRIGADERGSWCRRSRRNSNSVLFGGNSTLLLLPGRTASTFYSPRWRPFPGRRSRWGSFLTGWTTSTPRTC